MKRSLPKARFFLWNPPPSVAEELAGVGISPATLKDSAKAGRLNSSLQFVITGRPNAPRQFKKDFPTLASRLGQEVFLIWVTDKSLSGGNGVIVLPSEPVLPNLVAFMGGVIQASSGKTDLKDWALSLYQETDFQTLILTVLDGIVSRLSTEWVFFFNPYAEGSFQTMGTGLSSRQEKASLPVLRSLAGELDDSSPVLHRTPAGEISDSPSSWAKGWWIAVIKTDRGDFPYLLAFPSKAGHDPALIRDMSDMITEVMIRMEKIRSLKDLTLQDDLTCLYNYRFMTETLQREIERSRRHNEVFSVLFIDLDNFKEVNDKHGHLVGSELLKRVAEIMHRHVREYDTVARYGGDEFLVVMPETSTREAFRVAERLRRAIADTPFVIKNKITLNLTTSVGIATYPSHATTRDKLLEIADRAMYQAKRQKKNLVYIAG